jgi:hypothetical protein
MPLPTWLYAQGLAPAWNRNSPTGGDKRYVRPDPQEVIVQGLMVLAAGGKGLMWFQVNGDEADRAPARWQAIGRRHCV